MKRFFPLVLAIALVVTTATAAYGIGSTGGNGSLDKPTKVVIKNVGGKWAADGTIDHYVEPRLRRVLVTVDVKDKSVVEATYFGFYLCFEGETPDEPVTLSGAVSVAGKETGEISIRLPRNHDGCNVRVTATVLRPGQGDVQKEIVLKKMVLTADTIDSDSSDDDAAITP